MHGDSATMERRNGHSLTIKCSHVYIIDIPLLWYVSNVAVSPECLNDFLLNNSVYNLWKLITLKNFVHVKCLAEL